MITLSLFGPTTVTVDGVAVALSPARRRLLALLALDRSRPVDTDVLIERMWPDGPPATARTALHVHLSKIRRSAPGLIETAAAGYRLGDDVSVDVETFETLVGEAAKAVAASKWDRAIERCRSALELWRGDPFAEIASDTEALPAITRLVERRLEAYKLELHALLASGRNDAAIPYAAELVERYPLSERFRESLMLALYRSGRQAEAMRAYQEARRVLGEELGLEPGIELRDLEERILLHDPSLGVRSAPPIPHNLPDTPTSFIGRDSDLAGVVDDVVAGTVVTIVGGPGVGKTRLAVEAARELLDRFPGGVWMAELGGASSPLSVAATIARATRTTDPVDSLESLGSLVAQRPVLVVLDECEAALGDVRRFVEAFRAAGPRGAIVATSREPLGVGGETVLRIGPFDRATNAAVRMIVDRIRAIDRSFSLDDDAAAALNDLTTRVDGVPLALEVVARWVPVLGIAETLRLLASVEAPTGLETALDWSLGMLHPSDRDLLVALSVFAGPFTLGRVQAVCAPEGADELATAGAVTRLVEASLLTAEGHRSATVRYRMLGPVREFAGAGSGRPAEVARRHGTAYREAAATVATAARTDRQAEMFAAVDAEIADYRLAMASFRDEGDWDSVASIAAGLARYWYARFLGWEGKVWLDEALGHALSPAVTAAARNAAGFLAWAVHDYDTADRHYRATLQDGRASGDDRVVADALYGLGLIHQKRRFEDGAAMLEEAAELYRLLPGTDLELGQCLLYRGLDEVGAGHTDDGSAMLTEAVDLLAGVGHLRQVSKAVRWLAHAAWLDGDVVAAGRRAARAERIARDTGDQPALAGALIERGFVEITGDDLASAAATLREALDLIPSDDLVDVCQVLTPIAWLAEAAGDVDLASRVLGFVDGVYDEAGWLPATERAAVARLGVPVEAGPIDRPGVIGEVDDLLASLGEAATSRT